MFVGRIWWSLFVFMVSTCFASHPHDIVRYLCSVEFRTVVPFHMHSQHSLCAHAHFQRVYECWFIIRGSLYHSLVGFLCQSNATIGTNTPSILFFSTIPWAFRSSEFFSFHPKKKWWEESPFHISRYLLCFRAVQSFVYSNKIFVNFVPTTNCWNFVKILGFQPKKTAILSKFICNSSKRIKPSFFGFFFIQQFYFY